MKKILNAGIATFFFLTTMTGCVTIPTKKWVDNRIKEGIAQYRHEDRQWTKKRFEETIPQEQRSIALNSTYAVLHKAYYKTSGGQIIEHPAPCIGSSTLVNGSYLLTAKHVIDEKLLPQGLNHPYYGPVTYNHSKFSLKEELFQETTKSYDLEKIITGENLDYALLKVKDSKDLPFYNYGLNTPNEIKIGMQSIAIGFPRGKNRNWRLGNVEQVKCDAGENYLTFQNSIIQGDSGGPLFTIEDGDMKIVAIVGMIVMVPDVNLPEYPIRHPVNIGYGLKVNSIIKDIDEQLKSGKLDEKTINEVSNFLILNKN